MIVCCLSACDPPTSPTKKYVRNAVAGRVVGSECLTSFFLALRVVPWESALQGFRFGHSVVKKMFGND